MFKDIVGKLAVDLELNSSKFQRGTESANKAMGNMSKAASSLNKMLGGLAIAGGGAAFTGVIKGSLDAANRLNDLSDRIGTTAEGLSRLQYAADLTGVSQETLAMGLQRMTRRVSEAANGTGEAVGALDELGLSAAKLEQASPEQQFAVLADALEQVPDQADKVRLAMKLLDSEGVALLQTMKGGSQALREYGAESDKVGATISTTFAQNATAANAAFKKLGAVTTGLTNQLAGDMAPTIEAIAEFMSTAVPTAANFVSRAWNGIRAVIASSAALIVEALRTVTYNLSGFSETMRSLDAELAEVQTSLSNVADDFSNSVIESANGTQKLVIATGQASKSFDDYVGATESATDANKRLKEAESARAAALAAMTENASDVESIRQSLLTEEEAEIESYQRRLEALQEYKNQNVELDAYVNEIIETERMRHQNALTEIESKDAEKRRKLAETEAKSRFKVYRGMFGNLSTLMNTESKKLFNIGKAAAVANALVSGYEAVVHAYKHGNQIGGPILGAAFAATAAAATASQIASIKSQSFGGGGTVNAGTIGTSAPGVYNPPQPSVPSGPGQAQSESDGARSVNLVFNGPVTGGVQQFAEELRDFLTDSDFVLIESASRNGSQLRT